MVMPKNKKTKKVIRQGGKRLKRITILLSPVEEQELALYMDSVQESKESRVARDALLSHIRNIRNIRNIRGIT